MRIKKNVSFVLFIVVFLVLAIATFAAESSGGSYSSSGIINYVNTKATATKSTSQSWLIIFDTNQYNRSYPEGDSSNKTEGNHYSYLVNTGGTRITSRKTVPSGGTVTFGETEMDDRYANCAIKLQIHNPESGTILETKGVFTGFAE